MLSPARKKRISLVGMSFAILGAILQVGLFTHRTALNTVVFVLIAGTITFVMIAAVEAFAGEMLDRKNPHCLSCGYDMRGLPARTQCPECGRLVVPISPCNGVDIARALSIGSIICAWLLIVAASVGLLLHGI